MADNVVQGEMEWKSIKIKKLKLKSEEIAKSQPKDNATRIRATLKKLIFSLFF